MKKILQILLKNQMKWLEKQKMMKKIKMIFTNNNWIKLLINLMNNIVL